jgi:CelD/BcsL family acetyltransferase involved in cellulose biosynthesis
VSALIPERWRSMPGYSISLREFARWDDFVRTWPKSLRATLRRRHKRLEERGHVEFGWCQSASDASSVLTWLFDNKRRWAEKRGFRTHYLMDNRVRDFFIALTRTDPSSRVVAFVKVDGVPVAATVNLVGSRSVESFMTTYDEAFSKYSVGNLLTEYQAKWSHAHGRDLDLRAFYADYKETWANRQSRYQNRLAFLRPRGRLIELSLLSAQIVRAKRKLFKVASSLLEDWRRRRSARAS